MPYSLGVPVKATHARISQGVTRLPISIDCSPVVFGAAIPLLAHPNLLVAGSCAPAGQEAGASQGRQEGRGSHQGASGCRVWYPQGRGDGQVRERDGAEAQEGDGWTVDRGCVIAVDLVSPAHKPDTSVKADTARSSPKSRLMRWLGRGRGDLGVTQ